MKLNSQKQRWESPTDYIGKLPTTGKGVGVVVMDEGFDLTHPDLKGRVQAVATSSEDTFESDPLGHGTHVMGIIGSSGDSSDGRLRGIAPDANLFAMKVKLAQGVELPDSLDSIAKGMHWAVQNKEKYNIKVINCSFVLPTLQMPDPSKDGAFTSVDPLAYALNLAKEAGILVVAGVGNFADKVSITTPAGDPSVIAVGALDTAGTPQDKSDDQVAAFSSRGVSIYGENKPDILAPGVSMMSANSFGSQTEKKSRENLVIAKHILTGPIEDVQKLARQKVEEGLLTPKALQASDTVLRKVMLRYFDVKPTLGQMEGSPLSIAQDGTSEAAPVVTAVIANMYEANPELTPSQVKQILYSTASSVEGDPGAVGRGAINAQAAVQAALELKS
jgi:subtilisin family serine protease